MGKKITLDNMTDDEVLDFGCKQYASAIDVLCDSLKDFFYPDRRNYKEILDDLEIVSTRIRNIMLAVYLLRNRGESNTPCVPENEK